MEVVNLHFVFKQDLIRYNDYSYRPSVIYSPNLQGFVQFYDFNFILLIFLVFTVLCEWFWCWTQFCLVKDTILLVEKGRHYLRGQRDVVELKIKPVVVIDILYVFRMFNHVQWTHLRIGWKGMQTCLSSPALVMNTQGCWLELICLCEMLLAPIRPCRMYNNLE